MTERMNAYLTALHQNEFILMVIAATMAGLALIWLVYSTVPARNAYTRLMRWFSGWPFWTLITLAYLALVYALAFQWKVLEAMVPNA